LTRQGTRRLDLLCGEQGKLPTAQTLRLAERDKFMSEQKMSFLEELDVWIGQTVMDPLLKAAESDNIVQWNRTRDSVYKAIREKVLESYRNGQAACPRQQPRRSGGRYGR
jgi:hypothetical protein